MSGFLEAPKNRSSAAKRRHTHSLGREPQVLGIRKYPSREAATDILALKAAACAAADNLPPLQGWIVVSSRFPGAHAPG